MIYKETLMINNLEVIVLNEVLILCTDWAENYWEIDKVAPYPKSSIDQISHLKYARMIPGIGMYIKGKKRDISFISPCFIVVEKIEENQKGEPQFQFHFLKKIENMSSAQLIAKIGKHGLFFSLPKEEILGVLNKIGIKAPSEWKILFEEETQPSWQRWIGEYFLDILKTVSIQEYEDKIAEMFKALGFEVKQMGYRKYGEYPDGIILYSSDFSIVYDCKNCSNYFLDANDKRAMIKYIQDAKEELRKNLKLKGFTSQ